jgi:lysophospholipase L1-like esterase
MKRLYVFVLGIGLFLSTAAEQVAPSHESIRYIGRFTDDYRFGWTGCMIETDFQGTEIAAKLDVVQGPAAGITVIVDGVPRFLKVIKDRKNYVLAEGLAEGKQHRIQIFKRSEGSLGTIRFDGFRISPGGELFRPTAPVRKMLVIGDSITCGYGNEAATIDEGNTIENENGYMSYAPIAARALEADLMMFCWSGRGMYRNRQLNNDREKTIPKIFDQTLPMDESIKWDHSRFVPDVVAINLGTNDMALHNGKKEPLAKEEYISAYKQFLSRILGYYPQSKIIISIGPMVDGAITGWLSEIAADFDNISVLVYSPFSGPEDKGGHHHPSVKKDRAMAAELLRAIHRVTGWKSRGLQ